MTKTSTQNTLWGGIDAAKAELVLAALGEDRTVPVVNAPEGFEAMIAYFRTRRVTHVGIESTGIYHRDAVEALRQAGFCVLVLQPVQVRAYARFRLQRAKSDAIDARLIARCAADLGARRPPPDRRFEKLAEHLTLIDQITEDVAGLKIRRERFRDPRLLAILDDEIRHKSALQARELKLLIAAVRQEADLAHRYELLQSIQGIGAKTALMLVIRMPELGTLSREEAASLLGVAPYVHQSGRYEGLRRTGGGRARARTALFAAAQVAARCWNPALMALYERLRKAGKPHALAVTACTHKLIVYANTVLARDTPWSKTPLPDRAR